MSPARFGLPPSERELKVLQLIAMEGLTYKEVAHRTGTTTHRVENTVRRIMTKLGAEHMAHAVHLAHCLGIIGMYEDCGDVAAWHRHQRRKETADIKCRRAMADHSRRRRVQARRKGSAGNDGDEDQ